jgi:glycine dehydrogenase
MMGGEGLTLATKTAILNANYVAKRLEPYYPVLYKGANGHVAHECILDTRPLKDLAGIEAEDIAKRLMDYGFHAPTMSFPVAGTLMVEPTESEDLRELDRFCAAMIAIRAEVDSVARGEWSVEDSPLRHAPHTAEEIGADDWIHPYPRELAAFPVVGLRASKYFPPVGRIDAAGGDRHLVCSCPPIEEYAPATV